MVTSSGAVTTTVTVVLPPAVKATALVVEPDARLIPSTAIVAPVALTVGVNVPVASRYGTVTVYARVPVAKVGERVEVLPPALATRLASPESPLGTVYVGTVAAAGPKPTAFSARTSKS